MSVVTGRRLQRFWQKGIKPLKDLLGSHDIADLSEDGTVTGALSKLNTDMNAVADYVVERGWAGSDNSWFYTKWNSGYIEVESTRYLNATSGWTVYGKTNSGNTYANAGTWGKTYTFDVASGLFSGAPTACQLTCDWDCFAVADDMVNWTNTFIKTIIFSSGGMGVDNMLRLNIKLGGRWK